MEEIYSFLKKMTVISLAFTYLLFTQSCGEEKLKPIKIDPAFASYIISFTSGIVSNQTKVQVRMVQENEGAVAGQELSKNPFSFDPSIDGKAVWVDKQTVEFIPEEALEPGQIYTAEFSLENFVEVPDNLETLMFRFQVMRQAIQYDFDGFETYAPKSLKWQKIKGIYTTADYAKAELIEQSVEADVEGTKYSLKWVHSEDGKTHTFSIDSVERKNKKQKLQLEFDGDKLDIEKSFTSRLTIPALDVFKVVDVKTETQPKTCITVFFSDPINTAQNLDGLFTLSQSSRLSIVKNGSTVKIYPSRALRGEVQFEVQQGIKNEFHKTLKDTYSEELNFVSLKPQVELLGSGNIIPNTDGILFPFKAVSLSAVDVKIVQVFENNISQFLQVNQFDGKREIRRVGRIVYSEKVPLISDKAIDYGEWNTFSLDLAQLIETEPGAIYRVSIGFKKDYSLYACGQEDDDEEDNDVIVKEEDLNKGYDEPGYYYYDDYDDYDYDYSWYDRDNPCKQSYYMRGNHTVVRNVLASDYGIIAKAGTDGNYHIFITDLRTTEPLSGIEVELRNYQNQIIASSKTNSDGACIIQSKNKPFLLIAKEGKNRGYLRLDNASSLSVSMFNVQGQELTKGVKGFIYGERGVWRPGDSLFVSFILEDKNNALPKGHPVVMELYTPENQLAERIVKTKNLNGFYSFHIKTDEEDPTGNWTAKVKVGGSTFTKTLKIETVKPNRMKIQLEFPHKVIKNDESTIADLQVNWLHGAVAQNAKVTIDATLVKANTSFDSYKGYVFDDPSKEFSSNEKNIFSGKVNAEGHAKVNVSIDTYDDPPGMVNVQLKTRAFDAGGDFSTDRFIIKYSPYKQYVGLKMPQGSGWNNALYSNEKNIVPIALVDENGKPKSGRVKVEVFSVYWRYWWDVSSEDNLASYISNSYNNSILKEVVDVEDGKLMYEMNLDGEYWGRKFIRITDLESGHSSGTVFYTTYKGWWSNAGSDNPGGAEMLMFETDKKEYSVGDEVTVKLPVMHSGRALVAIESGSKVVQSFWVDSTNAKEFTFTTTPEMSPNVYIHISYIQPHNHNENDSPIRMYGIENIKVEDPKTHVTPVITMAKTLKPEQEFTVNVKETDGKAMTYTIAIVDDGLLDLTRFKTPNPWSTFYSQEALGVRTWDLYKYVAGAYTGELAGLLQIGGDEYANKKDGAKANRFKPVVMFKGPFALESGKNNTHTFTMPNYVGSVRCMVVAGQEGAYGSAEQTVPVRKSLMVLPTLPRVVSPTETIKVPVTVFAMEKGIKNVKVTLKLDENFTAIDGTTRDITFKKEGEQVVEFTVKVKETIAQGKIEVVASSGNVTANAETNLEIRMPNPSTQKTIQAVIEPGKTWEQTVNAIGITGTNSGVIELSEMTPINLERRLQYLIQYPHGCVEQTTSSVFPQLFLNNLVSLSEEQKVKIENNVAAGINRLTNFQVSSGGFSYWPGEGYESSWGTNYAGHFLVEAQSRGYELPVNMLDNWITYQTSEANSWRKGAHNDVTQAYRLYTLALAKKPATSAMNRMLQTENLSNAALWRLAAAYVLAGKPEIANTLIAKVSPKEVLDDEYYYYSYGSQTRDQAMILETLVLMNKSTEALAVSEELTEILASEKWMSTQTTAYVLLGMSKFASGAGVGSGIQATGSISGVAFTANTEKPMYQKSISFSSTKSHKVKVKNTTNHILYLRVQLEGVPLMTNTESESSNLDMTVKYYDMKGNVLNPKSIKQGTDFYAEVKVSHPGYRINYKDMSLTQLFASGWEITNTRMDLVQSTKIVDEPRYQDIRDDRVYSYFDIRKNQTNVYRVLLHAAYLGKYYMPATYCEAMYDNTVYAKNAGYWVEVVK